MNSNWPEEYIRKSVGYYIAPTSSPEENSTPNVQAVEDKPYFASNIKHYPHLKPSSLTWVPDYLSYSDLKEAVDKGFDPKQLRPTNIPWPKFKSQSNTLFDWPKYTRTGGQYAHGNANGHGNAIAHGNANGHGNAIAHGNANAYAHGYANATQKMMQENLRPPNGQF